jgi:protein involved in polysaccharide export with SLBB domain
MLKLLCRSLAVAALAWVFSTSLQAQTSAVVSGSMGSSMGITAAVIPATGTQSGTIGAESASPTLAPEASLTNNLSHKSQLTQDLKTKADAGTDKAAKTQETDPNQLPASEAVKIAAVDDIEFQRFVKSATGQSLRLYGYDLFANSRSFSAVQAAPVPAGYILGPGDELIVQVNGLVEVSERMVIDRDGRVQVPKVGPLNLAGVSLNNAEKVFTAHLGKVYRNFTVSITMGRLRSIEVFVVGQARQPGKHLVSSLSSAINALFETGGPGSNGSLRAVEVRRLGTTVATIDLYAFLARGDNTSDVQLLSGDIIYIPPAGARAALLGTINAPAIYELRAKETINDLLAMTGGLPTLAAPQKAQLERMEASRDIARYVEDFALDAKGLSLQLKAGDILTVFQISPQIANVVTLQGNVASPLRYTFKPGMRISDLLSDKRLLIPGSYWSQINQGVITGNYSRPEVNLEYATVQRLDPETLRTKTMAFNLRKAITKDKTEDLLLTSGDIVTVYRPDDAGAETEDSISVVGEVVGGTRRFVWRPNFAIKDIIPSPQWLVDHYSYWQRGGVNNFRNDINWDYAQVIRRVPATLSSKAITFNLGNAVLRGNPIDNIVLEPGDKITLFTTSQIAVPQEKRIQMVSLSGEVLVPGVYQTLPGETLPQLIKRVGGLTPQAYVFGTELSRESVKARQQQNLDTLVRRLETQSQSQQGSTVANRSTSGSADQTAAILQLQQAQLKSQIERLKSFKSNGRLSLELDPANPSLAALPDLPLEDGDRILVPSTPGFVAALGSVNNENMFIFKNGKTVGDVIKSAGLTEDAEPAQAFVLRADGSIVARNDRGGWFGGNFESMAMMPGDTLVVPAQLDRESRYNAFIRGAKDWTQILANLGLGVAALRSL